MPDITMPNGDIVNFPDTMPEDKIKQLISQKFPQETSKLNPLEGIARAYSQGSTFGLGDEVVAGLASVPSYAIRNMIGDDVSLGETYNQILQDERQRAGQFREENAPASIAAEIGGGVGTGIAGTGTKAGASLANWVARGGKGAQAAKGALTGATSGGLYGYGTGEGDSRLGSAAQGAAIGGATGAAYPYIASALKSAAIKTEIPTAQAIKDESQKLYTLAREQGAQFTDDAITQLQKSVKEQIPFDDFAKKAIGEDEISAFAQRLDDASKSKMSLDSFESLDKWLGSQAQKAFNSGDTDLSRRLGGIQADLRDIVTNPKNVKAGSTEGVDNYRKATSLWSDFAKMRDIEEILENAEYYVGGTASGIKAGFSRLAKNPKKMRGFSKEQQEAIRKAAKTGATEGLLRTLGSRLMVIGGAVSGGAGGALAGQAASSLARSGAEALKGADATRIGRMIAERSGMVKQTPRLQYLLQQSPEQAKKLLESMK